MKNYFENSTKSTHDSRKTYFEVEIARAFGVQVGPKPLGLQTNVSAN